jgi:arylsulfatase A-like enzyme
VLFIVLDTVRAQNLSIYGYERSTTPELERIFASGDLYEQAIASAPWTLPSHASMFTGRWPHELSSDWSQPLDDRYPTLAEILRDHGYMTGAFVANTYYTSRETGLDRGFIRYQDFPISAEQVFISSILGQNLACWRQMGFGCHLLHQLGVYELPARKNAEQVNEEFLDWVGQQGQRPFFAFLNYFDAHAPYLPPDPYATLFGSGRVRGEEVFVEGHEPWGGSAEQLQTEIDQYDGAIAYIDAQIGSLVDELNRLSLYENTILIVVSDHGEEFREHGVMSHANSLYRPSVRVPLLILTPQSAENRQQIANPYSLRNLPLTVLDLIDQSSQNLFGGKTLSEAWLSNTQLPPGADFQIAEVSERRSLPEWYPISKGGMSSIICDGWRYIRNGDGSEEIYDLVIDPQEMENLILTEKGLAAADQCREALDRVYAK